MIVRTIITTAVWFFAVHYALYFGGIWHSQVHPTLNVEVSFKGGNKASGSLKRAWNGDNVLITADGAEKHFTYNDTNYLAFTKPTTDYSVLHHWRAHAPAVLLIALALFVAMQTMRKQRRSLPFER